MKLPLLACLASRFIAIVLASAPLCRHAGVDAKRGPHAATNCDSRPFFIFMHSSPNVTFGSLQWYVTVVGAIAAKVGKMSSSLVKQRPNAFLVPLGKQMFGTSLMLMLRIAVMEALGSQRMAIERYYHM